MTIIVLGVGDTSASDVPDYLMKYVAIPPGTIIDVYAHDAGLVYGPDLPVWEWLGPPWATLNSDQPAPNLLELYDDEAFDDEVLINGFPAFAVLRPAALGLAHPLRLCTGGPGECPATREEIEEGFDHQCDGLLGFMARRGLSDNVHLVLASAFTPVGPAEAPARSWLAYGLEARQVKADSKNLAALAAISDVGTVYFAIGMGMLILSRDPGFREHSPNTRRAVQSDAAWLRGELLVHQASANTASPAIVMRDALRPEVQSFLSTSLARVWDHEVMFTDEALYASRPVRRSTGAARFLQTEPDGPHWDFDEDAAFSVNQRELKKASPSYGFTDTRNNRNELHYRIAGGMLLISRSADFAAHLSLNLQYVKSHWSAQDASKGGLFVYMPEGDRQTWVVDAVPNEDITPTQQHLLRRAVQKLGDYEINF